MVASVLAGGKNSRLYKRLVYDMQIAQDVSAFQQSGALGSPFLIVATARPGHTAAELQTASSTRSSSGSQREPPDAREVERALNQIEASFYRGMERVGGFGGKADQLNAYYFAAGGGAGLLRRGSRALHVADAGRRPGRRRASGCPPIAASSSSSSRRRSDEGDAVLGSQLLALARVLAAAASPRSERARSLEAAGARRRRRS